MMTGLLVGYGSIGRRHLENLHALGVEDWVVVHTGEGTLPFEPLGVVRVYSDLSAALAATTPTFAVIANPTAMHVRAAIACARRGCALLIEKPVSDRLDDLDALRRAVADAAVQVLVGFQFRFDPGLQRVRELLGSGAFGSPLHARVVWGENLPAMHPWEDWRLGYAARRDLGGGVHHSLCHPFDYLRMLFGEATSVTAKLHAGPLRLDVAEAADVVIDYGAVAAQVHLDFWSQPSTHRVEITCQTGSITWDYVAGALRTWSQDDGAWGSIAVPGVADRNALFVAEARHFLDIVNRKVLPQCSLEDGIRAVEMCVAIERADAVGVLGLPDGSSAV